MQKHVDDILAEVARAEQKHPKFYDKPKSHRMNVLGEEYGEACQALVQYDEDGKPLDRVRTELIQTAAVCIRFLESLDRDTLECNP